MFVITNTVQPDLNSGTLWETKEDKEKCSCCCFLYLNDNKCDVRVLCRCSFQDGKTKHK